MRNATLLAFSLRTDPMLQEGLASALPLTDDLY